MSTSMSVLFLMRKDKRNDQSESPIYMRVTIAGQRFEVSTKRSVLPTNWSAETGRVKGITSSAKSLNNFLGLCFQKPTVISDRFSMKAKSYS